MKILQKIQFVWPEDSLPITFPNWIESLSPDEKQEWNEAAARQNNHRQQAIKLGYMIIVPDGFLWKDRASYDAGHILDETWLKYFQRYQNETGVKILRTYEEQ